MIALFIILGILLYLTISTIILKLLIDIDFIYEDDTEGMFGAFVILLPIIVLYLIPVKLGKWIAEIISDYFNNKYHSKRIIGK